MNKVNNLTSAQNSLPGKLARASSNAASSLARLASGLRLQRASDDVASLSIATQMQARISALRSASNNITQATSLLQVADGGLQQIDGITQRMRSLSVLSLSGAINDTERSFLNLEFQQLKQELGRLSEQTRFNGIPLLNGEKEPVPPVPQNLSITGTNTVDHLIGGDGNDTINPLDDHDYVNAGAGDDLIKGGVNEIPGLIGEIYDSASAISNIATSLAIIGSQAATATFHSSALDYVPGPTTSSATNFGTFLGADGTTLSNPAISGVTLNTAVFRFSGNITIANAGTYNFTTASDDGFRLTIGGNTFSQFPGIRGFGGTTNSIALTAGKHSFELIYFENAGSEGLEVRSSLVGGSILNSSVLSTPSSLTDGDDTIIGGAGNDTVSYSGNIADYTITPLGQNEYLVTDIRTNSPNGSDRLSDVENLTFADGNVTLGTSAPTEVAVAGPRKLNFPIGTREGQAFTYQIVDATLTALFDDAVKLAIDPFEAAREALDALDIAIDRVTERRAYVGSKASQASIIGEAIETSIRVQGQARASLADADITTTSTDYTLEVLKSDFSVLVLAQTNALQSDSVLSLIAGVTDQFNSA